MAKDASKTLSEPRDNEVKIYLKNGGYSIIPKLNQDETVRLNAAKISYIEQGGEDNKPPEVNIEEPTVEEPTETPDPSMGWDRPKLLKFAKKERGIKYTKDQIKLGGLTKTEIISDILTHKPE